MWRRFRPPLGVVALVLVGLIGLLAMLQYRWLGQISEAERERLRAGLTTGANEFAADFDRELARAFLLFQPDGPDGGGEERFVTLYERWQASARFPRLIKDFYLATPDQSGVLRLNRLDPAGRRLEPVEWPPSMAAWRDRLSIEELEEAGPGKSIFIRRMPTAVWETVPAIVVPRPMIVMAGSQPNVELTPRIAYSVLTIDLDYVSRELLPLLAARHFHRAGSDADYQVAVVSRAQDGRVIFRSSPSFAPSTETRADATADLFQVRTQDFAALGGEVRRLSSAAADKFEARPGSASHRFTITRPLSILIQPGRASGGVQGSVSRPAGPAREVIASTRVTAPSTPHWKLVVAHPAGSLEAAVNVQRTRNLVVSSSILGLLGASMGLLVLSTRRAQRLARQQMEFVATVSHELRTPLAVIRSAAENLADGVVYDEQRIRRYGELMRTEGRRLTEMVEQTLEFAGIESGQRGFALRPVAIGPLVGEIISSSSSLIEGAGVEVELDLPEDLPPVLGDEQALRRVFQNLLDNAIKYGASGGWIRVSARASASAVLLSVTDRGIGIEPAEQARIFEPFYRAPAVLAAQMHGAGLGLSLVQRIVAAHGGRVTVKSTPGDGTELTVQLPIASREPITRPAPASSPIGGHAAADAAGPPARRYS
jgi:signal transduction histidine kinase